MHVAARDGEHEKSRNAVNLVDFNLNKQMKAFQSAGADQRNEDEVRK